MPQHMRAWQKVARSMVTNGQSFAFTRKYDTKLNCLCLIPKSTNTLGSEMTPNNGILPVTHDFQWTTNVIVLGINNCALVCSYD